MRRTEKIVVVVLATVGLTLAVGGTVWAMTSPEDQAAAEHDHESHDHGDDTTTTLDTGDTVESTTTTSTTAEEHDHGLVTHDTTDGADATATDEANAQAFYDEVAAGTERFADVDVAIAEGYVITDSSLRSSQKVEHYMRRADTPAVLDPTQPEGLVYWVDGDVAVLLGVVFTETDDENLAQPGGSLTVWHDHTEAGCPDGFDCDTLTGTPPKMMHVWLFDGADPFAHDFPQAIGDSYDRDDPLPFL